MIWIHYLFLLSMMCQKFMQSQEESISPIVAFLKLVALLVVVVVKVTRPITATNALPDLKKLFGRASAAAPPEGAEELEDVPEEIIASGADSPYVPSTVNEDPLDDDLVPECPPPGESDEEENFVDELTSGISVTASVACDAASILSQDHVQEMFQEAFDQGGVSSCFSATATPEVKKPNHGKGKHKLVGKDVLFELHVPKTRI